MNGGSLFSKLDLSKAYSQIYLHEESKPYTTLTTHKGMYSYNRLPFGVSLAEAIFQRTTDQIFNDMPQVLYYQNVLESTAKLSYPQKNKRRTPNGRRINIDLQPAAKVHNLNPQKEKRATFIRPTLLKTLRDRPSAFFNFTT